MSDQNTVFTLLRAIPKAKIFLHVGKLFSKVLPQIATTLAQHSQEGLTPTSALELEVQLQAMLRSVGRAIVEWYFQSLEIEDSDDHPGAVFYEKRRYRKMGDKTRHDRIVTRFGNISLTRARYRRGRSGKTIAPLEKALGIVNGFTPAAADWTGRDTRSLTSSLGGRRSAFACWSKSFGKPRAGHARRSRIQIPASASEP